MARNLPLTLEVLNTRDVVVPRGRDMIESELVRVKPIPSMWKVLLFRIAQAEQRDRILSDWEDNVFGIHLSREEKQRRTKPVQLSLRPWART